MNIKMLSNDVKCFKPTLKNYLLENSFNSAVRVFFSKHINNYGSHIYLIFLIFYILCFIFYFIFYLTLILLLYTASKYDIILLYCFVFYHNQCIGLTIL
jgi:hypothetical protein